MRQAQGRMEAAREGLFETELESLCCNHPGLKHPTCRPFVAELQASLEP